MSMIIDTGQHPVYPETRSAEDRLPLILRPSDFGAQHPVRGVLYPRLSAYKMRYTGYMYTYIYRRPVRSTPYGIPMVEQSDPNIWANVFWHPCSPVHLSTSRGMV